MANVLIRQFDVFTNPGGTAPAYPCLVVLQSDAAALGRTVISAPLVASARVSPSRLLPAVSVLSGAWTILLPELAPVPRRILAERVDNLDRDRHAIVAAIDLLFTGV